jgi:hypothetical protein
MVAITSEPVGPETIDYYLGLLPDPAGARERLSVLTVDDPTPRPLAVKVLEQPAVIQRLRETIGDPHAAFIAPFNVGPPERELALALEVPLYGPDLRFYSYGTKSGGRQLFADEQVAHPAGAENVTGIDDLVAALLRMRAENRALTSVVVKLGDSVFGIGNIVIALSVVVSNQGGRQIDGEPATMDVLTEVVDEVGDEVDVLMDGGVRQGEHVLKALALGARCVLIGRPVYWGLAAGGGDGVRKMLELLTEELRNTMQLAGVSSASDVPRDLVVAASELIGR